MSWLWWNTWVFATLTWAYRKDCLESPAVSSAGPHPALAYSRANDTHHTLSPFLFEEFSETRPGLWRWTELCKYGQMCQVTLPVGYLQSAYFDKSRCLLSDWRLQSHPDVWRIHFLIKREKGKWWERCYGRNIWTKNGSLHRCCLGVSGAVQMLMNSQDN